MKRPADDTIINNHDDDDPYDSNTIQSLLKTNPSRRSTRSMSRRLNEYVKTTQARRQRAIAPTPFESSLSIVLSKGLLYRYDCTSLPLVSKGCNDVWREVEKHYPEWAEVRLLRLEKVGSMSLSDWTAACHVSEDLLTSVKFLRTVFNKINNLQVAAQPTKKKRAEAEAELLRWGVDIHVCTVSVWDPNEMNNGGIYIGFGKKNYRQSSLSWMCRLHPDLRLMTGLTKRGWRIYDGKPLWP